MKTNKTSNGLYRLVAFLLVATVLVFCVGFVASGWQGDAKTPDSGDTEKNNGKTDENKDGKQPNEKEEPDPVVPAVIVPEYTDPLSGLEIDAALAAVRPVAFVSDPSAPLYGISAASLTVEFPTEDGKTRLLSFCNEPQKLGKIGSLAPLKGYIQTVAKALGGITVCRGNEETKDTSGTHDILDLNTTEGYCYTENSVYAYTNADLLTAALINQNLSRNVSVAATVPYQFVPFGQDPIRYEKAAASIQIPYSEYYASSYVYDSHSQMYSYHKGGAAKTDLLNGKNIQYKNVIVLFADAITYEYADNTRLVLNTMSCGTGYALTEGTLCTVTWSAQADGSLSVCTENGAPLTVNRGVTSLSFFKSSRRTNVTYR